MAAAALGFNPARISLCTMCSRWIAAALCTVVLFPCPVARAQDKWTFTGADFRHSTGTLHAIDDAGFHISADPGRGAADTTLPLDAVLRAERESRSASASVPRMSLYFQNGDRLAGEPGEMKDDALAWTGRAVGALSVPVVKLRGMSRLGAPPPGLDDERKEDVIQLSNRDVVRGVISGISAGTGGGPGSAAVQVQTGADTVAVPLNSVETILFAAPPKAPPEPLRAWRARLTDGSVLTVPSLGAAGGKLLVKIAGAAGDSPIDLANVISLEQLNGPVSWLSERKPTVSEQVPFNSETTYPARMDLNVFGKPMRAGAQTFDKGIGVHANSRLVFPLDGNYKLFRTRYAIDTSGDASKADVNVRILLDGKPVHEQKHVKPFKLSPVLSVELGNARELTLEVTAGGPTDTQDRFDWLEPALVRNVPATAPAATTPSATAPSTAPAATTATNGKAGER
jgi:hypothetical protein